MLIFLLYLLGFFAHALYLKKTVYGDGIFYYTWLRSLAVDHNINFNNEYEYFHINQPTTATGLLANKYPIGPALFWAAPFLLTHATLHGTGYELPYQLHIGATSVFFTLFGLVLLYRLLTKFFKATPALLTILAVAFATNLFFYGSMDSVNSHGLSFFAATLFLSLLLSSPRRRGSSFFSIMDSRLPFGKTQGKHGNDSTTENRVNWLAIGLSLGLLGLIRTQDLLYGILLSPSAVHRKFFLLLIGLFIGFLPQIISW